MAKPVDLTIEIDENGDIKVKVNGTEGTECLENSTRADGVVTLCSPHEYSITRRVSKARHG